MKKRKLYKKLLIILVLVYVVYIFINQQKVLNQYASESKEIASKIKEQEEYNTELNSKQDNVNSKKYIEQIAREKLDMVYPNEKIYIDKGM